MNGPWMPEDDLQCWNVVAEALGLMKHKDASLRAAALRVERSSAGRTDVAAVVLSVGDTVDEAVKVRVIREAARVAFASPSDPESRYAVCDHLCEVNDADGTYAYETFPDLEAARAYALLIRVYNVRCSIVRGMYQSGQYISKAAAIDALVPEADE